MDTPYFDIPAGANEIMEALKAEGFESFVVGGAVRDTLLGNTIHDVDIATNCEAKVTARLLIKAGMKTVPTGIKHGTITAVLDDGSYEVTTYRIDGEYHDSRHPSQVTFPDTIEEDLARRDFTINAMAYSHDAGLIDPFAGILDLRSKIIRCVGDPKQRFSEDALRIIRALRFASELGFMIEEGTAAAIHELREGLNEVSRERIRDEFVKLIHGKGAGRILREYEDVISTFIPQLHDLVGLNLNNPLHIHDAWEHSLVAFETIQPRRTEMLLAALLHDIGKGPKALNEEWAKGVDHAEISRRISEEILHDLRFPNYTIKFVGKVVGGHDYVFTPNRAEIKRSLRDFGQVVFLSILDLKRADILAHGPEAAEQVWRIDEIRGIAEDIIIKRECYTLGDLEVSGSDVREAADLEGKQIAKALGFLLDKVIDGEVANDREDLLEMLLSSMPLADSNE